MYYMGFSYIECYNIAVWQRIWFIKRINEEIKKANGQSRAATDNSAEARAMLGRQRAWTVEPGLVAIGVGRVEKVDAQVQRPVDHRDCVLLQRSYAEGSRPDADLRHSHTGPTQDRVLHGALLIASVKI